MKRGIYLIGEAGLINSRSGAGNHISEGIKHLSQEFEIVVVSPETFYNITEEISETTEVQKPTYDNNKLRGFIRNIKNVILNLIGLPKYYSLIKEEQPDFIYERASFLNFNGFIISNLLNVPIFYEVNGIMVQDHKTYYNFYGIKFLVNIEKWIYEKSTFTFFIGTYGDYFKLKTSNWINTENGINRIKKTIQEEKNYISSEKNKVAFVGTVMKHHNFEALLEAISEIDNVELHLIGNKNVEFSKRVNLIDHGYLNENKLNEILSKMDIGIVPPLLNKEYSSLMKLFNYGINKCLVIAPRTYNLNYWFKDYEVVFYDPKNVQDLKTKLIETINRYDELTIISTNLYTRVSKDFTWDKIFNKKIEIMKKYIINPSH